MQENNILSIVQRISNVEYVNKINSLINKLMYSSPDGFVFKKSRQALFEKNAFVEKFLYEANNIKAEFKQNENIDFLNDAKIKFLNLINKHCYGQIPVWIDEVFDEMISNLLFELSIDKAKKDEIFQKFESILNWYGSIKSLDKYEFEMLKNNLIQKFEYTLQSNDNDYLDVVYQQKTDVVVYCKIWNLILDDADEFANLDLSNYSYALSELDLNYFYGVQAKIKTHKKTQILDEFMLIKSAADSLNFADARSMYEFIIDIQNDFKSKIELNKTISEEEKIELVKRRIVLSKKEDAYKYYSDIISF